MSNEIVSKGLNAIEWKIAELLSKGKTRKEVANELGISISEVYTIANRKPVKHKVEEMTSTIANEVLNKHVRLLDAIIESKLEKLEKEGKELSEITNKDIIDLLNQLSKLRAENDMVETRAKLTSDGGGYASILQSIIVNNNTTVINNNNVSEDTTTTNGSKKLDIMKDSIDTEVVDE
jgi:predicted transcriptional regulator